MRNIGKTEIGVLKIRAGILVAAWCCLLLPFAAGAAPEGETQGELLSRDGKVDWAKAGADWRNAAVGQPLRVSDRLRTQAASRAMVQLAELGRVRVDELTTLEILPPREANSRATIDLKAGAMYFFTRERPREFLIQTPYALAASRGTEFLVNAAPGGRTLFTVFDGEMELSNPLGTVIIRSGEQGGVNPGEAPRKTAVLETTNIVQWWLYYPAVLDADELPFSAEEKSALADSLLAYRQGDLLAALENYPGNRAPQSEAERTYFAAILLAVGRVDAAEAQLTQVNSQNAFVRALGEMMAVVAPRPISSGSNSPASATEWLAQSYVRQSQFDLGGALAAAQAAAKKSPNFSFAWERVAELDFSQGHTTKAKDALAKSLALSPRNAQAWALAGFLEAADDHWNEAQKNFDQAIAIDGALGNGWLGRGLVRLRRGDALGGRADLQTAAAMEPNRSLLRSYLGKAFENAGNVTNAEKELRLAKALDENDPTPWLYSALVLRQQLQFNDAVRDLEKSEDLNDNRRVYRSRLLLDEDQAVRSASLATIYQDAGMRDVSVREAARAVASDYGNYSAHLFLAESFDALRDPTRFNLRLETAWFTELLLANLLSPVGGGNLSQNVTQQEYSRLFTADREALSSDFEGRSDGQYRELASQSGTAGKFSYSLDLDWQHNDGIRPNNELDRTEWYTTAKYQLSPQDSLLALAKYQDYHSGDNFQRYDQSVVLTNYTFDETQKPLAVAGYHREWAPGVHTLFLGGYLENDQRFSDKNVNELVLSRDMNGNLLNSQTSPMDVSYRSELRIWTSELNQIFQTEQHLLIVGARYQEGTFRTTDDLELDTAFLAPFFNKPPAGGEFDDRFQRITGYGYYTWSPRDDLHLTAGVAYDKITYPPDLRSPPVVESSDTRERVSPKTALVWSPAEEMTVRATYNRSLGGVSLDESFRLEPAQLAGFNQAYRSVISESEVGSVSAPTYETAGLALDFKFKSQTYVGLQGQAINSQVHRQTGVFNYNGAFPPPPPTTPSSVSENLDYHEYSASAGVNQLLCESFSVGSEYTFTRSKLHDVFPQIPVAIVSSADSEQCSDLHLATAYALFNHRSGLFARWETQWFDQANSGYSPAEPGDRFFMHNVFIGFRLRNQRAEASFGVLNLSGHDYKLSPLTPYEEMARSRVYTGRLKFIF